MQNTSVCGAEDSQVIVVSMIPWVSSPPFLDACADAAHMATATSGVEKSPLPYFGPCWEPLQSAWAKWVFHIEERGEFQDWKITMLNEYINYTINGHVP